MTQDPNNRDDLPDDTLPRRLRDVLTRFDGPPVDVPPEIDRRILADARAGFGRRARFRPIVRWAAAATAIAAVLAIVSGIWIETHRKPASPIATVAGPGRAATAIVGDINGDGKVDMLDAYLLAREIASGAAPDPRHDVNGDGVVDQRDVDAIANLAVRVGGANP